MRRSRSFWVGVVLLCIGVMVSSWLISLIMKHPDWLLSGIALTCFTSTFIVAGIILVFKAQQVEIYSLDWRGRRITEEEEERWLKEAEEEPCAWFKVGWGSLTFGLMFWAILIFGIAGFAIAGNLEFADEFALWIGSWAAILTVAGILCIRLGKSRGK